MSQQYPYTVLDVKAYSTFPKAQLREMSPPER